MPIIDFSDSKRNIFANYGGSDRKFGIIYDDEPYMIKFAQKNSIKKYDLATSSVNNCISEYIGSRIAATIGIPVHETELGLYDGELVVACKDFCGDKYLSQEFGLYMRMRYDSNEIGRVPELEQVYDVIRNIDILKEIEDLAIRRYWDTFIIDALLGNFDRHKGNWGYLVDKTTGLISLAPVYDYGSSLYPMLSDDGIWNILDSPKEVCERLYVFPNAALTINNVKVSYYDMLCSGYNKDCINSLLNIYENINMEKIENIIDETPLISEERKLFYKTIIFFRKKFILDVAYQRTIDKKFDSVAYERIRNGEAYTKTLFHDEFAKEKFTEQEMYIKLYTERIKQTLDRNIDVKFIR